MPDQFTSNASAYGEYDGINVNMDEQSRIEQEQMNEWMHIVSIHELIS